MEKYIKILAKGHENIKATHKTTFEITKEDFLTPRGDCIIGINATHSVLDLPKWFKNYLLKGKKVKVLLIVDDIKEEVYGYGSPSLILTNKVSMVFRKSEYIDDRTILVNCDKSARDLNREIIKQLKEGKKLEVYLIPVDL